MPSIENDTSSDRHAEIIRSMINHESDVINNRVNWLAAFQGLLFAALGFSWGKKGSEPLANIFCLLGISVSILLALISLFNASLATRRLLIWWYENKPSNYEGPGVIGFAPRHPRSFLILIPPWNLLPLCFLFAWLGILIIKSYG